MSVSAAHLGAATGTVSLSENGRMIAIRQLVHGATRVNFKLTSTPGNNVFTVRYSGSAAIAAGSRAVQFPTSRAAPRVRITAANASTVQVSVGGGPRAASGTVVAVMDGHPAGSARLSASGTAAVALHNVSTGNHSVRISYQRDPRYLGSSSGTITVHKTPAVTVNPCPPSARACVDLTHNRTWLQSNGHITYGPVPMQSGRPGYRTETGTFSVYWKDINHHSSIFDDAPMPYAIFFDGDTAFHQGSL